MVKEELIQRSPLRHLERSTHGGVAPGTIGVIAARKGTGKTACLVHIATDQLFQEKHVIHVSFAARTDHIVTWYEDIFREIAKRRHLEDAMDVHDQVIRNRVILNFAQDGVSPAQVLRSVRAIVGEGNFAADTIVVDGYDFEHGTPAMLQEFQAFAKENGLVVWFSASTHRENPEPDKHGVPKLLQPYMEYVSLLIALKPEADHVSFRLVKDHGQYRTEDLNLQLDSRTLLIREA